MKNIANRQAGFTLIEVMVVVVILGILAAVVVPNIMSKPEDARREKAKSDIRAIQSALDLYKLDNFDYPTTEQGLQALVTKPSSAPEPKNYKKNAYLKKVQKDPWKNEYQYLNPGVHGEVDIFTKGKDQASADDDIGNWNLDE